MLQYRERGGTDLEYTMKRNQEGDVKRYCPKGWLLGRRGSRS